MLRRKGRMEPDSVHSLAHLGGRIPQVSLIQTLAVTEHLNLRHTELGGVGEDSIVRVALAVALGGDELGLDVEGTGKTGTSGTAMWRNGRQIDGHARG